MRFFLISGGNVPGELDAAKLYNVSRKQRLAASSSLYRVCGSWKKTRIFHPSSNLRSLPLCSFRDLPHVADGCRRNQLDDEEMGLVSKVWEQLRFVSLLIFWTFVAHNCNPPAYGRRMAESPSAMPLHERLRPAGSDQHRRGAHASLIGGCSSDRGKQWQWDDKRVKRACSGRFCAPKGMHLR
jgi:hypothetical protein